MNRRAKTYEPEGLPKAWKRFWGDIVALSHSYPNLGAEAAGAIGLPRRLGKVVALFLLLVGLVALLHYSVI